MKRIIFAAAVALSLSACGSLDLNSVVGSSENYKPPTVDDSQWTAEQKAKYPSELASCQQIANSAISEHEKMAMLYSDDEFTRVTEKRRAVRRQCLAGRGFHVLY